MDITTKLYTLRLQTLTNQLLFMSESEYPWEIMYLGYKQEDIKKNLGADARKVDEIELMRLLKNAVKEENWHGEDELATARKYQQLAKLLEEELHAITVFRYGEVEIDVFVVGQLPNGEWVALKTKAIET
jgi:L-fucose isomerase-like protein